MRTSRESLRNPARCWWCSDGYQQQETMLQVLVGLDAAVLSSLVVQGPRGVEEGDVTVTASAEVNLLQLQLVRRVQVLLGVPQHPAVHGLTCRTNTPVLYACCSGVQHG